MKKRSKIQFMQASIILSFLKELWKLVITVVLPKKLFQFFFFCMEKPDYPGIRQQADPRIYCAPI